MEIVKTKKIQVSLLVEVEVSSDMNFVSIDSDGDFEAWKEAPIAEPYYWKGQVDGEAVHVVNFKLLCFKV